MQTFRTHWGTLLLHIQLLPSVPARLFWSGNLRCDSCSRRPKRATSLEFIAKVHKMVMEDCRLKVREIAEAVGMSPEQVYHILTEELGMKKIICKISDAALDIGP